MSKKFNDNGKGTAIKIFESCFKSLREQRSNREFFLVCIFLYSVYHLSKVYKNSGQLGLEVLFLFLPTDWVKIILEIVSKWPAYELASPKKILFCFKMGFKVSFLFLSTEWVKILLEIVSNGPAYQASSSKNILIIKKGDSVMKYLY